MTGESKKGSPSAPSSGKTFFVARTYRQGGKNEIESYAQRKQIEAKMSQYVKTFVEQP